jgi:hypothetical protein
MPDRLGIAMKIYGWIGFLLLLTSEYFLFRKIQPFYSWFYCFAWWSYILMADNLLLKLRGYSLLTTRRKELWYMLPLSVFIWLLFEAYNLRVNNWAYDGVPSLLWVRWLGYIFAFATVLPGIFITSDLIEHFLGQRARPYASESEAPDSRSFSQPPKLFPVLGLLLCVAPLVWPRYFFPAVWLGAIFLLDPFLEKLGLQSLWGDLAARGWRKILSLLLGGFACGLMWEFWNYWAASKWIYSVPFLGGLKLFEMPMLGFFGFPPFALECWILYHLFRAILEHPHCLAMRFALWSLIALFSVMLFRGIDRHTVVRFADTSFGSPLLCILG